MSSWVDGFEQHSIHTWLNKVTERTNELLEQIQDENLDRIIQVLTLIRFHLQNCDPELVSFTILQELSNQLSQINSYYDQYLQSNNTQYLINVGSYANQVISHINQLNVPKSPPDIEGIKEAIVSFRRSLGQNRRTLNEEIEAFNKELESLRQAKNEIEKTIGEMAATLEAEKDHMDTRQEEVIAEIQKRLDDYQNQLSTLLEGFQHKFQNFEERHEASEEERSDKFEETIKEFEKRIDGKVQDLTNNFNDQEKSLRAGVQSLEDELNEEAKANIFEIKELEKEAKKLVNAMGYMATGSGYQQTANESRKTKNLWRWIASLAMVTASVYSIVYAFTFDHTSSWPMLTAKLLPAFAVGSFAAYASRLAALAYQEERYNRKMALELAAIGPYLSEIDPEKAREIKGRLADRFFANDPTVQQPETQYQTKESSGINAQEIITKLLEVLTPNKK